MMNLFKKKPKSLYKHDLSKYDKAFTCKGVDYYCFKSELEMPMYRFKIANTFLTELEMRINREMLIEFTTQISKWINKGDLSKVAILNNELKERTELITEVESMYKLASTVYFDLSEDLTSYDMKHNQQKIADWKEDGMLGFFFTNPMSKYINLGGMSEIDLANYLTIVQERTDASARLLLEFSYKDK